MENILKKLTLASGNLSKIPFFCDKEASEERIFFKRKIKEGRRYGCIDTIFIFLVDCVNKMAASENFTSKGVVFFGEEEFINLINFFLNILFSFQF